MPVDESFAEAWSQRFGSEPPEDYPELASILRHRSIRHYSDRPVSRELVEVLIGCGASASTSSGLQLWSVISVEDGALRAQVAEACDDQAHVHKAPWFLAFLIDHQRIRAVSQRVGYGGEGLDYTEFFTMAVVDAALVAERMACAAEAVGLGLCYIGGLRNQPDRIKELLGLPEGTFGLFGFCLGYPAEPLVEFIKPRLDLSSVWFRDRYGNSADVQAYDNRMAEHFAGRGQNPGLTWSMRSARRTDNDHLMGREALKEFLHKQGFNHR